MSTRPNDQEYAMVDDEEKGRLSMAESEEGLLSDSLEVDGSPFKWKPLIHINTAGLLLLVTGAALLVITSIKCTLLYEHRGSNTPNWRPAFSPLYELVDIRKTLRYTDGSASLDTSNPQHIYRLPPSPELEAAWDRISAADGIYPMSASDVVRAGKDPAMAVDAPASWGFPAGKTKMMGIEAFHQLHCLNALRKALIINYHHYWGVRYGFAPPTIFTRHLNHCVDMLRQHLMCHADLEPFTFNWREGQLKPYADFEVQKSCIDFDALMAFAERQKDPRHKELWKALEKPAGALQREAPAGIPHVTNETIWTGDKVAITNLTGLDGKQYCLG